MLSASVSGGGLATFVSAVIVCGALAPGLSAASSPVPTMAGGTATAAASGPDDPAELARFTDAFMASALATQHAPGATVEVVAMGRVLLENGYGVADLDRKIAFKPTTRLRAKSVSKAFTATAVMQLVESGAVDLSASVVSYLHGLSLPGGNDPPITLDQLLTQTSGLGDRGIGTMTTDRNAAADLRRYLETEMPPRVFPPGSAFLYTDHGISLAGLVVQEIAGVPFAQYMKDRLLGPLGMEKSTFDPPLDGQTDIATGYQWSHGSFMRAPVGYFQVAPAVALVTTGHDMGRFLRMMLEGGAVDGRAVLRRETVALQQARHYALQPSAPGVAYGLYEWPRNGERLLVHGGLGHGYSTLVVLIPEHRVGVFIGTNSDEPELRWSYLRAFMDHYFPVASSAKPQPIADADLARFAGTYREYRYDGGRHEVLKQVIDQGTISVNADATLSVSWAPGRWAETAPLTFQNIDEPDERLSFQADDGGRIVRVLLPPDEATMKVSTFGSLQAFIGGFVLFLLLFLSAVIRWLARGRSDRAVALFGVAALLNAVFLVVAPILFLPYAGLNGTQLDFGEPLMFDVVFAIPFATGVLAVALLAVTARAWHRAMWRRGTRLHLTVIAIAAVLFPFFLNHWRLLGLGG